LKIQDEVVKVTGEKTAKATDDREIQKYGGTSREIENIDMDKRNNAK
jgi:hypothetical protein